MSRRVALLLAGAWLSAGALCAAAQAPGARALARAESLAAAGRYPEAGRYFGLALASLPEDAAVERAAAHFGRGLAAHKAIGSRADTAGEVLLRRIIRDYADAGALDPETYFKAASNNRGLALSALGDHEAAAAAFLAAARDRERGSARFLVRAGLELEELGLDDSAAVLYRAALDDTPHHPEARARLLDVYVERDERDSLVSLAAAIIRDGAGADLRPEVLLRFLRGPADPFARGPAPGLLDSALVLLVNRLADGAVGPDEFARTYKRPLLMAGAANPSLKGGIQTLLLAYRPGSGWAELNVGWWVATPGRRAAWSRLLTSLGGHHWSAGADTSAMRYYLAAVGYVQPYRLEPWVDLRALPALAELLGRRGWVDAYPALVAAAVHREAGVPDLSAEDRERLRDFHFIVGVWYTQFERDELAVREYERALALDSTFAVAYVNLGFTYMGRSEVPRAIRYFERAVALDPNDRTPRNNLGFTYLVRADFPRAIEQLQKSHELKPHLLTAINLGDAYRFAGDARSALRWHEEAERAVATRLGDEDYVSTHWLYNYMPLAVGDEETVKRSVRVKAAAEKLVILDFALSFDHAVLGDFAAADRYFRSGASRGVGPEFSCFFANKIAATEVFVPLSQAARRWLAERRELLARGGLCAP